MEIERKWLIDINNIPYNLNDYECLSIEQAYISFEPTIRIRKIANLNKYILTIKSSSIDGGLSRQEYEIDITNCQYEELLNKKEGNVLNKNRYKIPYNNYTLELDIFNGTYSGLAYIEIEFNTTEEAKSFVPLAWIKKELTGDKKFTNASLARGIDINEIL